MTTTTTTTAPDPAPEPPPFADLPPGSLACAACGVAVPEPAASEVLRVERWTSPPLGFAARQGEPARLTRCPTCAARHVLARRLLDAHPATRDRRGGLALDHTEAALSGLVVAGIGLPDPATVVERDARALLDHVAPAGAAVQFRALLPAVPLDRCAPSPWAHVSEEHRADVRRAWADLLRVRVEHHAGPADLRPPVLASWEQGSALLLAGGCLLCGVGAVRMPASQVAALGGTDTARRSAWRLRTSTPGSLGGRCSPTPVCGHVCPPCAEAVDSVGAMGPTAIERAVVAHLRAEGRTEEAEALRVRASEAFAPRPLPAWGAVAYARLRGRSSTARGGSGVLPPPNPAPWSHLPGVAR